MDEISKISENKLSDLKKIGLNELKEIELNLLAQIDKICREQEFRYSLIGGTLLGAVRHQGFIPWDDDIDIAMPRPDYERFLTYCHDNCPQFLTICNKYEPQYGYLFAKICDANTIMIEENANKNNISLGVYVDVFPVDGLGTTEEGALKIFERTEFRRELLVAANWKRYFRSKTHAWFYEPIRFVLYLLSRGVNYKKQILSIEKEIMKNNFDESKFCGAVCGSYRKREIMPQGVYSEYIEVLFEGKSFLALKNYDYYLKHIYGDYMQLPPEEKRITHHMFSAYKKL